jgi:parallel beta-helix repeat protein
MKHTNLLFGLATFFIALLLMCGGFVGAIAITNCSNLATVNGIYTLSNDLYLNASSPNPESCLRDKQENITINLMGYTVYCNGTGYGLYSASTHAGVNIFNGTITNCTHGIYLVQTSNVTISNLSISNSVRGIWSSGTTNNPARNYNIFNNQINNISTSGITFSATHGSNITNNILNSVGNAQTSTGIWLYESSNNTVDSNVLTNGTNAIYLEATNNLACSNNLIINNNMSFGNWTIGTGFGNGITFDNVSYNIANNNIVLNKSNGIRITNIAKYNNVTNNIFNNNYYGVFLSSAQNNLLSNNDFTNNTKLSIFVSSIVAIPSNNVFNYNLLNNFNISVSPLDHNSLDNSTTNMTLDFSKSYFYSGNNKNISVGILTNALVYFVNGRGYITSGTPQINISANNETYVLDNFNLTEGISRQYSPIWFSSSSNTEKHIASNLSESVSVDVVFEVSDCENYRVIDYSSTCSNGVMTVDNFLVNSGDNPLYLSYAYTCTPGDLGVTNIILVMVCLAVPLFIIVRKKQLDEEWTVGDFIIIFIGVSVALMIIPTIAQNIGETCAR